MRIDFEINRVQIAAITMFFAAGIVFGSLAFPRTITETPPAQLLETNCVDVNTMDSMLMGQIVFEKTNCYGTIIQDENGTTRIIEDCIIPQGDD